MLEDVEQVIASWDSENLDGPETVAVMMKMQLCYLYVEIGRAHV